MVLQINEITWLFETYGRSRHRNQAISLLQHALQCAHLAQRDGASPVLVGAALLHDLGHLLVSHAEVLPLGVDDLHQYTAIPFLRGLFADEVTEPIRLHVDAKRYLCAIDASYRDRLSPAAKLSLELQGGPFSAAEVVFFLRQPFALQAVAVRRWDDQANEVSAEPPTWQHFLPVLQSIKLPEPGSVSREPRRVATAS